MEEFPVDNVRDSQDGYLRLSEVMMHEQPLKVDTVDDVHSQSTS